MSRTAGVAIALLLGAVVAIGHARTQAASAYGVYSGLEAVDGDISGFEFIILPSNEGDFLVFQQAEGWPQKPLLLPVVLGGTRAADSSVVRFEHPEMGPFHGVIAGDTLTGEFARMQYEITLIKGNSFWQ